MLLGNTLLIPPALHSVVQGFSSALCLFPELRSRQLEPVREAGQVAWGMKCEIPITAFVTKQATDAADAGAVSTCVEAVGGRHVRRQWVIEGAGRGR